MGSWNVPFLLWDVRASQLRACSRLLSTGYGSHVRNAINDYEKMSRNWFEWRYYLSVLRSWLCRRVIVVLASALARHSKSRSICSSVISFQLQNNLLWRNVRFTRFSMPACFVVHASSSCPIHLWNLRLPYIAYHSYMFVSNHTMTLSFTPPTNLSLSSFPSRVLQRILISSKCQQALVTSPKLNGTFISPVSKG